jgi:hypothetical protein
MVWRYSHWEIRAVMSLLVSTVVRPFRRCNSRLIKNTVFQAFRRGNWNIVSPGGGTAYRVRECNVCDICAMSRTTSEQMTWTVRYDLRAQSMVVVGQKPRSTTEL